MTIEAGGDLLGWGEKLINCIGGFGSSTMELYEVNRRNRSYYVV